MAKSKPPVKCPVCKTGVLHTYDRNLDTISCYCSQCSRLINLTTQAGKIIKVAVPGIATLASTMAILHFFEIDNIGDLADLIDGI